MAGVFSDKIPQHRHCEACGKAFVGDGQFCGPECQESAGKTAKKKIRKLMLIWIVIVAATAAILFLPGLL